MDIITTIVVAIMLFSKPFWQGVFEGFVEGFGKAK